MRMTIADKCQSDLMGTKVLRMAAQLPYGTDYKECLELIAAETGRSPQNISRAIRYALSKANLHMYPREAIAAMQLSSQG